MHDLSPPLPLRGPTWCGIRRWDFVALIINITIGAGILGLPAKIYALIGAYSLVAYVAAAIVALIILCFAEVSSRFSGAGGPYLYAREAFGPLVGFEVGWLLWVSRRASFAALCNLFVDYAAYFWPGVGAGWGRAGATRNARDASHHGAAALRKVDGGNQNVMSTSERHLACNGNQLTPVILSPAKDLVTLERERSAVIQTW